MFWGNGGGGGGGGGEPMGKNGEKWGKLPIVKCFPHQILSPFFPIFPHPCADFLLFFSLSPIAFFKCCTVIGKVHTLQLNNISKPF